MQQNSQPHHARQYRADIDGMRAIAVLFVLGFHAFPNWIRGGFCGVDIFFVLSGFLISGILFEELEQKRFSYAAFYKRRIKRIFPALLTVLFASLGIGWFLLFDGEYASLGREVVNGAIFLSNFLAWQQSGYFDKAASTKPLLHLWSLGIEEQFYLLWPPLLGLAARFRNSFFRVTLLIAIISFSCDLGYLHAHSAGAYYSPLSRFWELMIGGLLAYQNQQSPPKQPSQWRSVLGFFLIALGFLVINESRDFPGWWALLPTLGTYLLLSAGERAWMNRRVLAQPILVWFGLISYPLYLWHWTLLTFSHILERADHPWQHRAVAVCLSVFLAWVTFRFIETPLRQNRVEKIWLRSLGGGMIAAAVAGLVVLHSHGLPFRAIVQAVGPLLGSGQAGGDEGNAIAGCGGDAATEAQFGFCLKDKREQATVALIGDSKAQALFNGLVRSSDAQTRFLVIAGHGPGGTPLPVLSDADLYQPFQNSVRAASDLIVKNTAIKVVVVTAAARALFSLQNAFSIADLPGSNNGALVFEGMKRLVDKFVRAGKKVVVTVDNPTFPDPNECVPRFTGSTWLDEFFHTHLRADCSIAYDRQKRLTLPYRDVLEKLQAAYPQDLRLVDPTDLLCDVKENVCSYTKDNHLLYSYTDHVSDYASGLIGAKLIPVVKALTHP